MQIPIDAPLEIKKKIARRLQKNGSLKNIETKIKLGMMVAVEELRENKDEKTHLDRRPFKSASASEMKAIQLIYNYLSQHNMTYTLSALIEESCVKKTGCDYNIHECIKSLMSKKNKSKSVFDDYSTEDIVKSAGGKKKGKNDVENAFDLEDSYSD